MLLAACAPGAQWTPGLPPAEGAALAAALEESTRLRQPTLIRFDWSISEQSSRASGQGVTRVEPPYRARLDLFLGDGTTAGRATLIGEELRVPAGMPEGLVPPPDLFWAALGVFRPGRESTLVGARRENGRVELRYAATEGREVHYTVEGERIVQVDLMERGRTVHRVTLAHPDARPYPGEANYRNLSARRELRLTTRSIEQVDGFPTDIWFPGR